MTPARVSPSSEHAEQAAVIDWVRRMETRHPVLGLLYAIPNFGRRSLTLQRQMKREGMRAGVLDLHLPVARQGYNALWIEMKYGRNTMTDSQRYFAALLITENNCVAVCYSAQEAVEKICWYLDMQPPEFV